MILKNLTKFIIILILSASFFYAFYFVADKQEVLANTSSNKLTVLVGKEQKW